MEPWCKSISVELTDLLSHKVNGSIRSLRFNNLEFGYLDKWYEAGVCFPENLCQSLCRLVHQLPERALSISVDFVVECEDTVNHAEGPWPKGQTRRWRAIRKD